MTDGTHICAECGREHSRRAKLCWGCYNRQRRRDPRFAQQSRETSKRWKDRNRGRNRKRDREFTKRPEKRGVCPQCGGPKGAGGVRRVLCAGCVAARAQRRKERIQALWLAGFSYREIADDLGSTVGSIKAEVVRMRHDGWEMPRRRPGGLALTVTPNRTQPQEGP
jgi:hypothetical protein